MQPTHLLRLFTDAIFEPHNFKVVESLVCLLDFLSMFMFSNLFQSASPLLEVCTRWSWRIPRCYHLRQVGCGVAVVGSAERPLNFSSGEAVWAPWDGPHHGRAWKEMVELGLHHLTTEDPHLGLGSSSRWERKEPILSGLHSAGSSPCPNGPASQHLWCSFLPIAASLGRHVSLWGLGWEEMVPGL